ncbi:protein encoded in hypervariable junctions of pilus gene clusters [Desulfocapsa sulfexigens DSM 10523]|uniref:Protein encoded in hypervariable junctions of pilus gene clusters n=1 Tax=Desulfocapsa sulfexigens (strain DSM 10523 / SB164P1) TaxID=1167006 RepID=M1PQV1_DESSD|nr:toxin-antitoxin system HicB family antitoxin [Desulfocapsa sulfexigens]AGF78776.1 protein encoded in hypervariable junctions of pilus gene clusters [Desulfocapsa sulfexigens DSM 10523]
MHKYSISTLWSEEDECFVATSMEFPFLSGFGETQEKATAQLNLVLADAIEILKEDGEEIPLPQTAKKFSGQFRLRLPVSLHERLSKIAEQEGISLNSQIVSMLQERSSKVEVYKNVIDELKAIIGQTAGMAKNVAILASEHSQYLNITTDIEGTKESAVGAFLSGSSNNFSLQ